MNEAEKQLRELEITMEQAKQNIDLMNALDKLINNIPEWKKVIEENYFEKEASRLVLLKADPSMQKDEEQKQIIQSIDAIGYFRRYLQTVYQLGRMAERALEEDSRTRQDLLQEQLEEAAVQ